MHKREAREKEVVWVRCIGGVASAIFSKIDSKYIRINFLSSLSLSLSLPFVAFAEAWVYKSFADVYGRPTRAETFTSLSNSPTSLLFFARSSTPISTLSESINYIFFIRSVIMSSTSDDERKIKI
jgi:hypothetical protein